MTRCLPRVRFTVRRMMVAVAIAGFIAGGVSLGLRRAHYQRLALKHQVLREIFLRGHAHFAPNPSLAAYQGAMQLKYERAARYPWLPVAPDPPGPE